VVQAYAAQVAAGLADATTDALSPAERLAHLATAGKALREIVELGERAVEMERRRLGSPRQRGQCRGRHYQRQRRGRPRGAGPASAGAHVR